MKRPPQVACEFFLAMTATSRARERPRNENLVANSHLHRTGRPSWCLLAMRFPRLSILLLLVGVSPVLANPPAPAEWNRVDVETMKTSIYVGSVKLITTSFVRDAASYRATYQAKVFPWVFWNENGSILITLTEADRAKLRRGERCEFSGEAKNHQNKPRHVTGYADPASADQGKIKVRIGVDDVELIFNGHYTLSVAGEMNISPENS